MIQWWTAVVEWSVGLAMTESRGDTVVVRCVVVAIGGAVSEQYGGCVGYDCTSVKQTKKKAPPGQTLFSNFLFSGGIPFPRKFFASLQVTQLITLIRTVILRKFF